jgi:hypothetical protein
MLINALALLATCAWIRMLASINIIGRFFAFNDGERLRDVVDTGDPHAPERAAQVCTRSRLH